MTGEPTVTYKGRVEQVYSGDDMIVMLDLAVEGLYKKQRIRLAGVDTPNGVRESAESEAGKVRAYVLGLCKNHDLSITVLSRSRSSWVASVVVHLKEGDFDLNDDLIKRGYLYKNPPKALA